MLWPQAAAFSFGVSGTVARARVGVVPHFRAVLKAGGLALPTQPRTEGAFSAPRCGDSVLCSVIVPVLEYRDSWVVLFVLW